MKVLTHYYSYDFLLQLHLFSCQSFLFIIAFLPSILCFVFYTVASLSATSHVIILLQSRLLIIFGQCSLSSLPLRPSSFLYHTSTFAQ